VTTTRSLCKYPFPFLTRKRLTPHQTFRFHRRLGIPASFPLSRKASCVCLDCLRDHLFPLFSSRAQT
jgi:hypothetical protein